MIKTLRFEMKLVRTLTAVLMTALTGFMIAPVDAAQLRIGDQVTVHVFNYPELSADYTVTSAGTIQMPLAGTIVIQGKEPQEVALSIERALDRYISRPSVEVQLRSELTTITVSGWPLPVPDGAIKYAPGETLAGAISALEVTVNNSNPVRFDPYRSRINMRQVMVMRDSQPLGTYDMTALSAAGQTGPSLRPGDAIAFIDKPVAVSVSGDVKQPGVAYLDVAEPLLQAIDQTGGLQDNAASGSMILTRDGRQSKVSVADATFSSPAHPGDSLFVQTAPLVTVSGDVTKPGTVTLKSDFSLLSAIYNAGGPDKTGDIGQVRLVHDGVTTKYDVTLVRNGDFSQNPQLSNGDEVYVPYTHKGSVDAWAGLLASVRYIIFP